MVIFFFILKKNSTCICRNKKWQDCNLATNTQLVRFNGVSPCNFQSGEWRWKFVFSNLHRWRQKWWCSGFLFSVRNFADRFFLNSVNLILKLFSLPHWLTSKFLLYPTFCLKVFHCDEFLKCYSKGILRIFIQRGYNTVCVAVFSWWMKEDCKIRIYCTLNFLGYWIKDDSRRGVILNFCKSKFCYKSMTHIFSMNLKIKDWILFFLCIRISVRSIKNRFLLQLTVKTNVSKTQRR